MEPLRLLAVDDEPLARLRLRTLLAECTSPAVVVVAEAETAAEAWQQLAAHPNLDGVLLDVHLPGLNGMQLAQRLRTLPTPPGVIFVSAHADHALQAFELAAVDYLTKPVRRARLHEALERLAARRVAAGARAPLPAQTAAPVSAPAPRAGEAATLVVSDRGRLLRIPLAELMYLKAELKYVTLRTATNSYILDDALSDLEQRLGAAAVRIHRNAVVARAAVRALERRALPGAAGESGWAVRVEPVGEWLAVSRRQLACVRAALGAGAAGHNSGP